MVLRCLRRGVASACEACFVGQSHQIVLDSGESCVQHGLSRDQNQVNASVKPVPIPAEDLAQQTFRPVSVNRPPERASACHNGNSQVCVVGAAQPYDHALTGEADSAIERFVNRIGSMQSTVSAQALIRFGRVVTRPTRHGIRWHRRIRRVLDREFLAPLATPAGNHVAAAACGHTGTEPDSALTFTLGWLICPLHCICSSLPGCPWREGVCCMFSNPGLSRQFGKERRTRRGTTDNTDEHG